MCDNCLRPTYFEIKLELDQADGPEVAHRALNPLGMARGAVPHIAGWL